MCLACLPRRDGSLTGPVWYDLGDSLQGSSGSQCQKEHLRFKEQLNNYIQMQVHYARFATIKLSHILQHSLFALKASIFLTDCWNAAI